MIHSSLYLDFNLDVQDNIIREFNLNELYQRSKKLNKGKEENSAEAEEKVPDQPEPTAEQQEDSDSETKKDK